jgi:hypothetical protein
MLSGTSTDFTKSAPGHVMPNLCYCIRWDLRVMSCIPMRPGHDTSPHFFVILGWDNKGFQQKHVGTRYAELVFCIWWDLCFT